MSIRTAGDAMTATSERASLPRPDVVTALSCYVVLLFVLPSRLTVSALGGAGPPAVLVGLAIGGWWVLDRLQRPDAASPGPHPVRRWGLVALSCVALSYVAAMTRAIAPQEMTTADLGMVALLSWMGVLLAAEDGVLTEERLATLMRRMVVAGALLGALGIVQFVTGTTWVDRIAVPGLAANQDLTLVGSRGDFTRPSGTALHPIEFGAVLTMLLPLAVNLALGDRTHTALRRWAPVGLIASAVVLSISRSALICAAVGMLVIAVRWTPRVQARAGLAAVGLLGIFFVTVPGLVGTLTGMFTTLGTDSSTLSRVDSYGTAATFIERSPVIGRGFSTFLPSYRILDNQYLLLLIEVGVLGTLAFLLLMVAGLRSGVLARRWSTEPASALRAQSLAAAVAAGATGLAFYDGFSFPMASGTLFLVLGLSGAQLRLVHRRRSVPAPAHSFVAETP